MIETSSARQPVEAKKIARKRLLTGVTLSRWSLPLILVFQALISWTLLRNTAFQDEALYIYAGEQIWLHWLHGLPLLDNYSNYFSGYPYVYPIIAGPLDMLGGLELVRLFSLVCMLIVTACGYYVTKQLFGQKSAVFAALFFVCQGPVLFLSRLATYDPLCLCLIAVATALAVNAGQAQRPWRALGIGPLLVLAFGAKYAALLFMPPVLAILALCTLLRRGWISMLVRGTLGALSLAVAGTLAAIVVLRFDPSMVHALVYSTVSRTIYQTYARLFLAKDVAGIAGLAYAVGLVGLLLLLWSCLSEARRAGGVSMKAKCRVFVRNQQMLLALLFLGSALLVPAYHIYKEELISLEKHLGFSMFFVMPVAGYALASLSGFRQAFSPGRYWLAGVAVCLVLFLFGTGVAQSLYSRWPTSTGLTYAFQTQVRLGSGHYLVEQVEVLRYYLRDDAYSWQWTGPYFFEYTDKQGHYYVGNDAYVKAVNDGYFDLIELNFGASVQVDLLIAQAIEHSKKYVLIAQIPQWDSYGAGYFFIWRKL